MNFVNGIGEGFLFGVGFILASVAMRLVFHVGISG